MENGSAPGFLFANTTNLCQDWCWILFKKLNQRFEVERLKMTAIFHGEKKNLLFQIAGSYKNLQAAIALTKKHCF